MTKITVTYSELDSYRQCPLKHKLAYKDLWVKDPGEGSALNKGILWHQAMEIHYKMLQKGYNLDDILATLSQVFYDENGNQSEDQELVEWMYGRYVKNYGSDEDWEILSVEQDYTLSLNYKFNYKFKIDLIVKQRSTGMIWLVDHKTASDFARPNEIAIDDQFGLYIWGLRKKGVKVVGVIRSQARTRRNKIKPMELEDSFNRTTSFRTDEELENIAADMLNAAKAAYSGHTPLYSSPDPRQCGWKCPFLEAHLLMRKGFDTEATLKDFGFEQRKIKHREYTRTMYTIIKAKVKE